MSPRPRKASDDDVFLAATRVMGRMGPRDLTLGAIAAEAGVTAGALVQRFGGKRQLLLALSERFAAGGAEMFAGIRAAHRSPLAALAAYVDCMADLAATPEALANNLAYLQLDLTDPEFRVHQVAHARMVRHEIRRLLRDALAAGELRSGTRVDRLAEVIDAVIGGSMMTWACHQEGRARPWMRRHLREVLGPHVLVRARRLS